MVVPVGLYCRKISTPAKLERNNWMGIVFADIFNIISILVSWRSKMLVYLETKNKKVIIILFFVPVLSVCLFCRVNYRANYISNAVAILKASRYIPNCYRCSIANTISPLRTGARQMCTLHR